MVRINTRRHVRNALELGGVSNYEFTVLLNIRFNKGAMRLAGRGKQRMVKRIGGTNILRIICKHEAESEQIKSLT